MSPRAAAIFVAGVLALVGGARAVDDAGVAASPHPPTTEPCEACHTTTAWTPARFPHDATGFPLDGAHARARCRACHDAGYERSVSSSCASCHREPHRGELGANCRGCHTTEDWSAAFSVEAHRRTSFPLTGRHAALPCEECHLERREKTFTRAARACSECHFADYRRAGRRSLDHARSNFSSDCRACHAPTTFRRATWSEHDRCFPIQRGSHALLRCADCHRSLAGDAPTSTCASQPFRCTSCHAHAQDRATRLHAGVEGFRWADRRCLECHRPVR